MSNVSNDFNVNVFIRRLQDILDERDMKQKELADLIGVSEVTISRYMNGERVPRIDIISSLAKALNTTTDYLLGNSDIKNPPSPEILKKLANSAYNNITYTNLMQAAGYICLNEDDKGYKNNENNNAVDTRKKLDEIIDDYLVKNELSLREFAQKCDLSHSYIATLRNGIDPRNNKEIDPTIGTLKKLSDGMNISLKELLIKANYMENDKGIKDEYLEVIKKLQEETIPAEDIKCFIEIIKNNRNSN